MFAPLLFICIWWMLFIKGSSPAPTDAASSQKQPGSGMCLSPNSPSRPRKYFLSVAVVCKDEADFIEEWALHYIAEGAEHLYVIDQGSSASGKGATARTLQRSLPPNMTTFVLPPPLATKSESRNAAQWAASQGLVGHLSVANMPNMARSYRALTEAASAETTWLIIVDSDEFMFAARREENIADAIRRFTEKHPAAGEIVVPWQIFGSSKHERQPGCIVPAFTWRWHYPALTSSVDDHRVHGNAIALVKSIVRLDALPWQRYGSSQPWAVHAHRTYFLKPRGAGAKRPLAGWHGCDGCLCPKWVVLNAAGGIKSPFDAAVVRERTGRVKLDARDWMMHDYVDLAHSALRLHHYRFRSKQWMLRVKACRSLPLLGSTKYEPAVAARLSKALRAHVQKEDDRANVCDAALASRRQQRPAGHLLVQRTANTAAVRCSNGALFEASSKVTYAFAAKPQNSKAPHEEAPDDAYVQVGAGCGLLEKSWADHPRRNSTVSLKVKQGAGHQGHGHRLLEANRPWTWPSCPKESEGGSVVSH